MGKEEVEGKKSYITPKVNRVVLDHSISVLMMSGTGSPPGDPWAVNSEQPSIQDPMILKG